MSEKEFNVVFSKRLRYYLNKYDMTQLELAKRLGVGATSVYNWCNGIKSPRMDKVDTMCDIFHCRRSDLMEEKSTNQEPTYTLTPKEEILVSDFRTLNEQGQDYILQTMDLVKDKYKKSADISGMEKIG